MFSKNKNKNKKIVLEKPQKNRRGILGQAIYLFCLLVFIAGVFYAMFFSVYVDISEINISGNRDIDASLIKENVVSEISGKYWGIFKKENYLLVRAEKMEKIISEKFKKIREVRIEKKFPDKINIRLAERESVLAMCSNGDCFIIDEKGVAYGKIDEKNFFEEGEHLLILKDENERHITLKEEILDAEFVDYLLDIKFKLEDLGIEMEKEIRTPQLISGDLRVRAKEGWMIYLDKNIPIEKEMKMLEVVLREELKDIPLSQVEYIDLRSENKVYYRLRSQDSKEEKADAENSQSIEGDKKD